MRKIWIDNLRWVTVVTVLLYHVIYFYNNKGVFGGIGGFGDVPQYQDVVMYMLYPWFMPLLFILAGISSRYALENHSDKEWFKARTRKLLVPATIGLFVFQWMVGYFNVQVAGAGDVMAQQPFIGKYLMCVISGTGPLWFIQDLWLFSLVLLLIRKIDAKDKLWNWCRKLNLVSIFFLGIIYWASERTLIFNPRPESLDGLWNLYKPLFYIVPFLLGYFVFSHDEVQEKVKRMWMQILSTGVILALVLVITTFGQNNTSPQYLASPLNCFYGWTMCVALMGWFSAAFDYSDGLAKYMTRASYGIYIVHYLFIASLGYMLYTYTQLPPELMYVILIIAVYTLSPLLYEIIRRIPVLRWCVLGI